MGGKRYSQLFCDGLLMAQRVNHDGGVPMKGKPFKPGNKSAWKPGQSGGNSGGRKSKDLRRVVEEFGSHFNPKMGKTRDEHLIEMLYRQGCQGNVRASELYLAYRWGKPVQYTVAAELSPEQKVAGMTEEARHARCRTAWNGYRSKTGFSEETPKAHHTRNVGKSIE
jgi:hypothetical protein